MLSLPERHPEDAEVLKQLADISFDQQVFTKATGVYERYLALQPADNAARTRYASALTFTQTFSEAETELKKVLTVEPQNFQAQAYLSITYSQMGATQAALDSGKRALEIAPSDEARARFKEFLDRVETDQGSAPSDSPKEPHEKLIAFVRDNPIAGPKFAGANYAADGTLTLQFSAFPMDKMPPFAKEKFLNGIKDFAEENAVKDVQRIKFADKASGAIMEEMQLNQ